MRVVFISFVFALMIFSTGSCVAVFGPRPPAGTVVIKARPAHYKIVRVKGKKYYHWNGKHHKRVRGGYIIVRF